ncbi:DUF5908 family protein [Mucilaginibacter jinjuensis]|uniref:DUF5908 family protein n=1 Tax=Mucilaginibacter jinjuensis TaxID=1176721 RepID=A0ABY7T1Q7_9SPHI|nr:DUF5908 family protein [Mucilaginibacter jinjuensis]WCT10380.1 DUF5908 family protein [Mucilaginibacter jinjuensis]
MPLEIRELHIKVTVNQPQGGEGTPAANGGGGGDKAAATDKEKVIKQCIEEVMDIINNKNER